VARISIGTPDKASPVSSPPGMASSADCSAYFDRESDPLHLYQHRLEPSGALHIGPMDCDCVGYVWEGSVTAGNATLPKGSSLVIEHGAEMDLTAGASGAVVLTFAKREPPEDQRAGGHVHLLPDDRVPRSAPEPGAGGASGGLHADALCPTCEVWLHEYTAPGMSDEDALEVADRGVHSHSEDEIIFVTCGSMRLGTKLYGPGTALAIAADTMYSFTPGPDGLSFINFRAGHPEAFRMKNGQTFDEAGYWRERVSAPVYL
jgi:hypothetical protein